MFYLDIFFHFLTFLWQSCNFLLYLIHSFPHLSSLQVPSQYQLYKLFFVTSLQHRGIVSRNKLVACWPFGRWNLKRIAMISWVSAVTRIHRLMLWRNSRDFSATHVVWYHDLLIAFLKAIQLFEQYRVWKTPQKATKTFIIFDYREKVSKDFSALHREIHAISFPKWPTTLQHWENRTFLHQNTINRSSSS